MTEAAQLTRPTLSTVLSVLTRERLLDLGRATGTGLRPTRDLKRDVADVLSRALGDHRLEEVLGELGRDELRIVCRSHGLSAEDGKRAALIERVLQAAGHSPSKRPAQPDYVPERLPQPGQVLIARGRQWLVERTE